MFTQDFCNFLEYHLSETLSQSTDIDRRRCWCDGIYLPDTEKEYSIESVRKTKQIRTRARIDEGKIKGQQRGQFIYELSIRFGPKALAHYEAGLDLKDCLPPQEKTDWLRLDREKRKIEIQLL